MNEKNIIKTLIITIMITLIYCPIAYCTEEGTTRMEIKKEGTVWTNINVSESYEECESLNSITSTLGTTALEAHLTTDYDWSAMAVFSASQYGSITSSASGIYDINYATQTTTLLNTSTSASTAYLYGLYDENGNIKKYVNKINPTTGKDQLGRTAIAYLADGGTLGWLGAERYIGNDKTSPVGIKKGLFGFGIGISGNINTTGEPRNGYTFRPVIWN